jgi:hypothetical protein
MQHDSQASLLAYNLATLCLGHKPKAKVATMDGCFGCSIPLYKNVSFNYRLNVPKQKFPMTFNPWMGSRRGKGWGIYISEHAH